MTPFEQFFRSDFARMLDRVSSADDIFSHGRGDISTASWDRKAAYLLWEALGRPTSKFKAQSDGAKRRRRDAEDLI